MQAFANPRYAIRADGPTHWFRMPEGDTIWRAAARLRPALVGHRVVRFRAPRLVGGVERGTSIDAVGARGKYLLVGFDDGQVLETHMKMTGSWHLYRSGETWQRSRSAMRALIEADNGWVAVCFSAPHVRLVRPDRSGTLGPSHLGPDLTGPAPDLDAALARFAQFSYPATPVAVALLDQRICCGVGNVYKSEVLHALAISPDRLVRDLDLSERRAIVELAHRLLRQNLGSGPRQTVPGGLAVYGKRGEPCPRCGEAIVRAVHGEHVRSTYFCPSCQA